MSELQAFDHLAFLAELCFCGHSRQDHRRPPSVTTMHCLFCKDRHHFETPEQHERYAREAALQADPAHVHGPTHTAYACPGFIPFQVCDACGARVTEP
jgi:hypothetical protein